MAGPLRTYTDINIELKRVVVTFSEIVELHDVAEMLSTSDKARVISFATLMDARQARSGLSLEDLAKVREILLDLATRSRLGPCAVVVSDLASKAIVDASGEVFSGLVSVAGFLDRDEAERWLGWESGTLATGGG